MSDDMDTMRAELYRISPDAYWDMVHEGMVEVMTDLEWTIIDLQVAAGDPELRLPNGMSATEALDICREVRDRINGQVSDAMHEIHKRKDAA